MVSANTSNIPKNPCFTGFPVSADACAIGPVPSPASFENIPLDTPFFMLKKKLPIIPPVTALGLNAPYIILPKTSGNLFMFRKTTPSANITYISAMKGTSFSVTNPILLIPPSKTSPTSRVTMIPMTKFIISCPPGFTIPYPSSATFIAAVIVFT